MSSINSAIETSQQSASNNPGNPSTFTNQQLNHWVGTSPYVFDHWAPFEVQVEGPHQIPVLRGVDNIPSEFSLLSFSRKPRTAPHGFSIVHFWESDKEFSGVFRNPVKTANSLSKFSCVTSPDPTLYTSHAEHMRLNAIWRSRAIAAYFEYRGLAVIPHIRWTSDSDLEAALAGIRRGSVVAVSNHGCYRSDLQKKEFRRGLSRLLEQLAPTQLLLHGTDDCHTRSVRWGGTQKVYRQSQTGRYFGGAQGRG